MFDLIKFNLDSNNENPVKEYIDDSGNPIQYLNHLSKVNIFIGKNNSGKSRFMRKIISTGCQFYTNNIKENSTSILYDISRISNNSANDTIEAFYNEIVRFKEMSDNEIFDVINKFYQLNKNNNEYKPTLIRNKIQQIFSSLNSVEIQNKIYLPTLRGVEKFSKTTDEFMAEKDSFRLTIGERKLLEKYINQVDRVYYNKVKKNYFPKTIFRGDIHTGEKMYDEIQIKLLGNEEERKQIKDFEEFLSKNFFDNKRISLIPNIKDGYLYINIDGEEHELHNLGDGIKQLIVITYEMYIHKDEKALFFIEEPELNLHPGLQRKLIEIMLSDEFENQQYFITTHSNHLIDLSLDYEKLSIYRFDKENEEKIKITYCSGNNNDILTLIGVKPSSIFNSNCTIWVEGITDRLYIRKYLELYESKLLQESKIDKELREDIEYSFVEYSGGNITHWNFIDSEANSEKINAKFLSQNIFLIADNDFAKKGSKKENRLKWLEENLKENFYKLQVREIENLLTRDILLKIVKIKEKNDDVYFKPEIRCNTKKFTEGHIGEFLNECVKKSDDTKTHKYTYGDTKALYNKLDFCNIALSCLEDFNDLSDEAKLLTQKIYEFIKKHNKI